MAWAPNGLSVGSSGSNPNPEVLELLAVGCWDQTLSFYQATGVQHLKDRKLHFYPCSLSYFSDGEYIVIGGEWTDNPRPHFHHEPYTPPGPPGPPSCTHPSPRSTTGRIPGSDRRATLCTKEAVRLCAICDKKDWVWSVCAQPYPVLDGGNGDTGKAKASPMVAVGCYGGTISVYTLNFSLVHGLHQVSLGTAAIRTSSQIASPPCPDRPRRLHPTQQRHRHSNRTATRTVRT